ncbi:MAG: M23 family metallopeptidase [Rhizobiales bacterium]|nr:M23 family metallopeptidase [Hyphomicrobiales bacterium]NRB15675.1 M23 family metallopeptidase [Hyphomicrobiales bacterium]
MALYSENIEVTSKWMWSSITTGAISLLFFAAAFWGLSTNMNTVSTVFISQSATFNLPKKAQISTPKPVVSIQPKADTKLSLIKQGKLKEQKVNRTAKRDSTFAKPKIAFANPSFTAKPLQQTAAAVTANKVGLSPNVGTNGQAASNVARKTLSQTQLASLNLKPNDAAQKAQSIQQTSSTEPATAAAPFKVVVRNIKVKSGDTLLKILRDNGANTSEAHAIVTKLAPHVKVDALEVGQPLSLTLDRRTNNTSIHPIKIEIPVGYRASRPNDKLLGSISISYNKQNELVVDLPSKAVTALSMRPTKPLKAPKFTPAPQKPLTRKPVAKPNTQIASLATPKATTNATSNVKTQTAYYRTRSWVKGSFKNTVAAQGVPKDVQNRLLSVYNQTAKSKKIKSGDILEIFYDQQETSGGKFQKLGKLLYISFKAYGKVYTYFRYGGQFYDDKGTSINPSSGGVLAAPVPGVKMNSKFGMRRHPITKRWKMHSGSDFAAPRGTPIYAAASGKILIAKWNGGAGRYIRIDHQNGYKTAYFHMNKIAKGMKPGKMVRKGQIIGYVGSTGMSTGNHLHFEVIKNDKKVNPMKYIGRGTGAPSKLTGTTLAKFKKEKARITSKLNQTEATTNLAQR